MFKTATVWIALCFSLLCSNAQAYSILVFGDSLSAAYGIPVEQGWVSLLRARLAQRNIEVLNYSISGETTSGGVERISQALSDNTPEIVILELGANDALQGKEISYMRQNLATMIQSAQEIGAEVLLLGMNIPPNYGRAYAESFHQTYLDLAEEYQTAIVPFFLEPVALNFDMFQADGRHPTAEAQPLILDHVWPELSTMIPTSQIPD